MNDAGHVGSATQPAGRSRRRRPPSVSHLTDGERLAANIRRAYADLIGDGERAAPIDLGATRRDMIAFNGGHPPTWYA